MDRECVGLLLAWTKWILRLAGSALIWAAFTPNAAATPPDEAQALRLRLVYASMAPRLEKNQFNRPLVLDSIEGNEQLKGDIYAVMNFPLIKLKAALSDPTQWCEVMILHFNTKYCRANTEGAQPVLRLNIGKKTPQDLADSESIEFKFSVLAATPDYFNIALAAQKGPLGSSDYRIILRAVSLQGGKTFVQLTYSYATGWTGRAAMRAYLATLGRGKVGFTVEGRDGDGQIEYVSGVRGVIERNTMRYFLAIDSYMDSIAEPTNAQFEMRLHSWFSASEQYARQLHEMSWDQYREMKFSEHARMLKQQ
jgi:hypothetical protein